MLREKTPTRDWWGIHMDSLRGYFSGQEAEGHDFDGDAGDYGSGIDLPPAIIGQDERRMQVRAYNFWAGLLDNRQFPSIEDLDPESLPDFGPYSVLLDFTGGIEDPAIQHLGGKLAEECACIGPLHRLSDVPSRSLLSRITDHYMQILANQAPIGFEAEFVNQRGATILYRGILLPFSSDNDTIDFIYGVINWKELADQQAADELLLEIDQALEAPAPRTPSALAIEWADGPEDADAILELDFPADADDQPMALPVPAFGLDQPEEASIDAADCDFAESVPAADGMELADWLALAREFAQAAQGSEDRSRQALYNAIGRAYDFSLAAAADPDEFHEIVVESGLVMQDRAPMTPVVKLVFGADYDKTRLTEYASALSHGHRLGLERGTLADFLTAAPGGLKRVVNTERRLKREESGKSLDPRENPREALARKLRKLEHSPLAEVAVEGSEFTLLVARRLPDGQVVLLGEVADDITLLERVARRLVD